MSSAQLEELTQDNVNDCIRMCTCISGASKKRLRKGLTVAISAGFNCLDVVVRLLGPMFVVVVWVLIAGIVYSWYAILAPYIWSRNGTFLFALHAVFGHWLLLNIAFHYYKVTTVRPGSPPLLSPENQQRALQQGFHQCRKCSAIKPPRAHHCQVCKRCVLNMDHHCPWINGCVGHFNHRYFFLFMAFIWLGCVYVASISFTPFYAVTSRETLRTDMAIARRVEVAFCFVLTAAVCIALGLLLSWHVYLISTAQTTIEFYGNMDMKAEAKERGEVFMNPHDFGWRRNWCKFLGLVDGRTFLSHVVLPSPHGPIGDGLTWRTNDASTDAMHV